jgi:hypothetical protein
VLVDIFNFVRLWRAGVEGGIVSIGGAGAFDVAVLSGVIAVLLAEIFGKLRERLQGGPETNERPKELLSELKNPEDDKQLTAMEAGDIEVDEKIRGEKR